MKHFSIIVLGLSLIVLGCVSSASVDAPIPKKYYSLDELGSCPYVADSGATDPHLKYIKEAHSYIDWSEDFKDWHYHARERMATPLELRIYKLEQLSYDTSKTPDECDEFRRQKKALEDANENELKNLRLRDQTRFEKRVAQLVEDYHYNQTHENFKKEVTTTATPDN